MLRRPPAGPIIGYRRPRHLRRVRAYVTARRGATPAAPQRPARRRPASRRSCARRRRAARARARRGAPALTTIRPAARRAPRPAPRLARRAVAAQSTGAERQAQARGERGGEQPGRVEPARAAGAPAAAGHGHDGPAAQLGRQRRGRSAPPSGRRRAARARNLSACTSAARRPLVGHRRPRARERAPRRRAAAAPVRRQPAARRSAGRAATAARAGSRRRQLIRPAERLAAGDARRRGDDREQLGERRGRRSCDTTPAAGTTTRGCTTRGASQSRALSVDTSWTFAPIVLLALAGYLGVYVARWRTARREGGARAASGWRLAAWCGGVSALFVALISPVDRLGEQLASMHMVQHLLIADIAAILLTLGLTRHILRPATRRIHRIERAAGPFASPWFAVVAYVGAMWLWHVPALYDAALEHSGDPHARAPQLRRRRPPVLVAPALADPLAAAARRHGADRLHGRHEAPRRLPRASCSPSRPSCSTTPTTTPAPVWGMSAADDQHVAGLIMALEQSIVMGIALAWLFVRMLSESERGGAARGALPGLSP